jgi:hypothetical protein
MCQRLHRRLLLPRARARRLVLHPRRLPRLARAHLHLHHLARARAQARARRLVLHHLPRLVRVRHPRLARARARHLVLHRRPRLARAPRQPQGVQMYVQFLLLCLIALCSALCSIVLLLLNRG